MIFFSYCFKYMLPVLMKNFNRFYKVYFKVINHNNKFVRKFAAESFSHVLRKMKRENLAKVINNQCLKPFDKPYKYLKLKKTNEDDMETDSFVAYNNDVDIEHNEIFEQDFWPFEKQCNRELNATKIINSKTEQQYEFSFKEKRDLISTISNLLVETIYGIQKKLYTEWKSILDILIKNVKENVTQIWHLNLLRFTILQLIPRLEMNALHELIIYVTNNLGEATIEKIKESSDERTLNWLNLSILIIKDVFLYNEGYRAYPITSVTSIGFLYKLIKLQGSKKLNLNSHTLWNLVEATYVGYYNKIDEFIKIFGMLHKNNLIEKLNKMGVEYIIHFYSLAAMNDVNQKLHDFMNYEAILCKKGRTMMKNFYESKDTQRMSLIFKPLAKILFSTEADSDFDDLLKCFITIKKKIDVSKNKAETEDMLDLPDTFISKIDSKIRAIHAMMKKEQSMIASNDSSAFMNNKAASIKLWVYVKVLAISKHSWTYDSVIDDLDQYLKQAKESQVLMLTESLGTLSEESAEELLYFIPNLNNSYSLASVLKANLLTLKHRAGKTITRASIFNFDLNENHFKMMNLCLPDDSCNIEASDSDLFKLARWLFINKYSIKREVIQVLHKLLSAKLEKKEYNHNPIELMKNVLSSEIGLETEKTKANDIQRLMNVFRSGQVEHNLQVVYLYFLVGLYWVKFTPFHKVVNEALGELLGRYGDSINSNLGDVIDILNLYLSVCPNNSQLFDFVYPQHTDRYFESANEYKFIETHQESFMEILSVFQNVFCAIEKGIPDMSQACHEYYTDRFISFMDDEYYRYHNTSWNMDETKVKLWENDEQLLDNLVESNTIKVRSNYLSFRRNAEQKLVSYLKVLQDVDRINDTLVQLLSSREQTVQKLSLDLMAKTSTPGIKYYMKSLEAFVSDTDYKEEITKFSLSDHLKPEHRQHILPLIVRILIAKLHRKTGKSARKFLDAKRSQIYRFLASLPSDELKILIELVVEPFKIKLEDAENVQMLDSKLSLSNFRMYQGYSSSLEGIIKHLGTLVTDYLPILLTILTSIYRLTRLFYNGSKSIEDKLLEEVEIAGGDEEQVDNEEQEQDDVGHLKKDTLVRCTNISKLVLQRIKEAYEKFFFVEYITNEFSKSVLNILKDGIEKFRFQNITSGSALLQIFHTWSKHVDLHFLFLESSVVEQLCRVVAISKNIVHHEVYSQIFVIFKNIVIFATGETGVDRRDIIIKQAMRSKAANDESDQAEDDDYAGSDYESDGESDEDIQVDMTNTDNNISLKIVKAKLHIMIESIASFLDFNWETIKGGIVSKQKNERMLNRFDESAANKKITNNDVFKRKTFVKRIVYILSEISVHVNLDQKEILEKLANMLIPLVTIKGFISSSKEELANHTFLTIQRLCEKMPSLMTMTRFYRIARLLADRLRLSTRMYIWDLLYVVPDQKVKESVELVKEMNKKKLSKATLEYDYDAALTAYNKLADDFLKSRSYNETIVGLFNWLCWSGELSIRTACVHALEVFFDRYHSDVNAYANATGQAGKEDIISRSIFIRYHFLPCILRDISTSTNEMKLKGWFKVLRKYFVCIQSIYQSESTSNVCEELKVPNEYIDFACTIDNRDEHVDFFHNILNIKLQRRYKAIRQLCSKIQEKEIHDVKTLTKIVILVADMFVLRLNELKKTDRGTITYTKENLIQINNECYILYERVSEVLPWSKYQHIIKKHIIKVTGVNLKKDERMSRTSEKTLTKVICALIHGFRFDVPDVNDRLENMLDQDQRTNNFQDAIQTLFNSSKEEEENEEGEGEDDNDDDLDIASENSQKPEEPELKQVQDKINFYLEKDKELDQSSDQTETIRQRIEKSFIPALFKHLTDQKTKKHKKEEDLKIRINVAIAIIRLLRKTRASYFNSHMTRLIRTIVVCLKSKMVSIRDLARDALTQVNLNISPYLLHVTIDEMFKTLTRGYQRHIRSFTLHHLLENLVKNNHLKVGQIDHCLEKYRASNSLSRMSVIKYDQAIPKIVMDEMFGALAAEKEIGMGDEVSNFRHIKESKTNRTLASYEIIARHINFERSFVTLIRPIIRKSETSYKHSDYKKCEEIMDVISGAILKNPSVTAESLLVVLYSIMKRGTTDDDLQEDQQMVEDKKFTKKTQKEIMKETTKVLPKWSADFYKAKKKGAKMSKKIMVNFALVTLKKAVNILPIEENKDKLNSFCELYIGLMKSTENKVVVNTLHLLSK